MSFKLRNADIYVVVQILFSLIVIPIMLEDWSTKFYQVILAITFTECILVSMRERFFNIYQLFLFMMFFFNLSVPLFQLVGLFEYPSGNMLLYDQGIKAAISDETLRITYKVLIVFLLGTSIGWLLTKNNIREIDTVFIDNRFDNHFTGAKNIIKVCFYICIPLEIIYETILVSLSFDEGYVSTMHLHSGLGRIATLLSYIDYIYPFLGLLLIYIAVDEKEYKRYSFLFLVPYIVQLFTGLRGNAISFFLTILYVYSVKFRKLKKRMIISVFVVILIVILGIGTYRVTRDTSDLFLNSNNIQKVFAELCAYGNSISVLAYTIQNLSDFSNKVPFLFGYVFAIFSFTDNYSVQGILDKSYLAQHITYLLNPLKLLRGSTIGTSITAEFYEFVNGNLFLIFLLSVLLLMVTNKLIRNLYKGPLWFYFGMCYIQHFLMSPRSSVMKVFNKLSLVYVIIYIIINFLLSKKQDGGN